MANDASSNPNSPPRNDPYAPWRVGTYRWYAASWFLMTFAKQIETVAIGIYIYERTHSAQDLGWLGLVQALPVMLLAIPGGQMADRMDRRFVLASSVTVTMLVSLGLIGVCSQGAPYGWIYMLLTISAAGQALGGPSRTALLATIVPTAVFANAMAWSISIFQISTMVGPAAGGHLVDVDKRYGVPLALAVVAVCRLMSIVGVLVLPSRRPERREPSISFESLVAGIRFVWSQTPILATITLDLFAVLLGGATYLLPVFAKDVLGYDSDRVGAIVGYLRSAEAIGAIAMALLLAHLPPIRRAGRAMLWAVAGFGAATIVFGLSRNFYLSFAAMFFVGAFDNISVVVRHTLVQVLTPDAMRGRVTAVNNVFIVASNDLGGLESGLTAQWFGAVASVVGGGIGTILVVIAAARKWPQILSIGSLGDLRPVEDREEPEIEETTVGS